MIASRRKPSATPAATPITTARQQRGFASVYYLDRKRMEAIDTAAFQATKPYPWFNPEGMITEAGYERLLSTLPDQSLFRASFGMQRQHGQQSHDRLILDYDETLPVDDAWHGFARELNSDFYRRFITRLFGRGFFTLEMHWHYTPQGCSVSPHCDSLRKLGSHIFYFNDPKSWDPGWGGETIILDDEGKISTDTAPDFAEFAGASVAQATGNRSLLFARKPHSWHGVRALTCPEGTYRKVFIIVPEDRALNAVHRAVKYLKGARAAA